MQLDYASIGKQIRHARIDRDMNQETLAEVVDLSPTHISNIENGKTKLSLPTVVAIANALGVSVDALLYRVVNNSKLYFIDEINKAFLDTTEYETRVMVQSVLDIKAHLRENLVYLT